MRFGVPDAATSAMLVDYSCAHTETLESALDLSIELVLSAKSISDRIHTSGVRPSWQNVLSLLK